MFTRTKTFTNKDGTKRTYLQLVETRREGNKVRQKVVANLGRLEDLQDGQLDRLIESLSRFSTREWVRLEALKLGVKQAPQWGPALIFYHLWQHLGLEKILNKLFADTQAVSGYTEAVFAMVLNRLVEPRSKRGVDKWVEKVYRPQFKELELHHYYRALDYLAEFKDRVEEELFLNVRNIFNLKLDLVFWDTTSTYFEGRGPEMAAEGYSKDHRPDCRQVVIGVLMTKDGFPVAHQVFPGNTADIETFRECLKELRKRFNIDRVVVVADRGMLSRKLVREIEEAGLAYIFGVKMRRLKAIAEVLSRGGRYQVVDENLKVKEVMHEGERYIICLNPKEAERDRLAREEMLADLTRKLKQGPKQLVGNRGYRRYLKFTGATVSIDEEKIAFEKRFDGKYVLKTNTELAPSEVAQSYKLLWQVERAFRELKTGLNLRPVYHHTDSRVRGHIMVCFLALVLETALCRKLKEAGSRFSYSDLLEDLKELRAVEVSLGGQRFLARTEMVGQAYEAFKALGLRPPNLVQVMPPN